MSGLENMKRQILDEANHSAEEQISKARTKAEEILREAREQMEEQSAVMAKKSEDETKDYAQRIASSSEMQRKQALLQAKQEVIQEVLNKAYQQVLHLEPESYFEMLQKLLETYALPQEGTIYFSAADLARMPQKFEDVIEQRGGRILESYKLFDVYEGSQITAGYKSVAYSITFRSKDHTLEEKEVTSAMNKILNGLQGLGIELRS